MTELLQEAFEEVAKLPPEEQNAIAQWILAELASERKWDVGRGFRLVCEQVGNVSIRSPRGSNDKARQTQ